MGCVYDGCWMEVEEEGGREEGRVEDVVREGGGWNGGGCEEEEVESEGGWVVGRL